MSRNRDDEGFAEESLPPEDEGQPRRRRGRANDAPRKNNTTVLVLSIVGGLLVCAGCGVGGWFVWQSVEVAKDRVNRLNDLKLVGIAYINCRDGLKRPPLNVGELEKFTEPSPAFQRVRQGEIVVIWNVETVRQELGASNVILAYDTRPDGSGNRLALFADGSAKMLTEAEFAATPKAQPRDGFKQ